MPKIQTPWGPPDTVIRLDPDDMILRVHTCSHGGIGVHPHQSIPPHIAACAQVDTAPLDLPLRFVFEADIDGDEGTPPRVIETDTANARIHPLQNGFHVLFGTGRSDSVCEWLNESLRRWSANRNRSYGE